MKLLLLVLVVLLLLLVFLFFFFPPLFSTRGGGNIEPEVVIVFVLPPRFEFPSLLAAARIATIGSGKSLACGICNGFECCIVYEDILSRYFAENVGVDI